MPHRFTQTRRVEFAETDMAGIMHFANFFRYMEETEHAFYRSLGLTVQPAIDGSGEKEANPGVGWPRVSAACDFKLPLRFEEEVKIELLVEEIRRKAVRYRFRFWKDAEGARALAATGRITVVSVKMDRKKGGMKAVSIPDEFRKVVSEAPREELEATE